MKATPYRMVVDMNIVSLTRAKPQVSVDVSIHGLY